MTASPPIPPSRTATDSLQIPPSVRCLRRRYLYTPFIRIRGCVDVSPKLGVPFIFNSLSFLNPHILIPYFLILISFFILFFLKIKASTAVGLLRYAYGSAVIFLQSTHEGGLWDSECCIMKAQKKRRLQIENNTYGTRKENLHYAVVDKIGTVVHSVPGHRIRFGF